ncbi:MAG: hypothetical protein ACI8ZX_003174 [Planctomycetota bacterium]|jgi:hypothetical protein
MNINVLFVLLSCFLINDSHAESISLKNAFEKKLISHTISVNEKSTHYHSPFNITVRNVSSKKLELKLDNGTLLIPEIDDFQNFIITEEQILVLEPGRSKKIQLKAMCIERHDNAPIVGAKYQISSNANSQLCKLSSFVESNNKFEPDAQFLMWNIAQKMYKEDELDKFKINEYNEVVVFDIDENGREVEVKSKVPPPTTQRELRVNGNFSMNLVSPKKVHIAMFTMENILVKELYNNPDTPTGLTKMKYAFNSLEFTEEKYQIKLVVEGDVVLKRIVKMSIE